MARILVIGGYGAFGSRVAERLARASEHTVIVAGRSAERAARAAAELAQRFGCETASAVIDAQTVTAADLAALAPRVVINASGPFQRQDYSLARACIEAGCHCIDLADARAFVTGITALDAAARARGVNVISGASTVPGLSSAVVAAYRDAFATLDSIDIGVTPGNHFDPGIATTASILSYVGRPIAMRIDGAQRDVYGWQGLSRRVVPGIGPRLFGYCEVPDLDLFPAHDPKLKTVRMQAGVEVAPFHLGLWGASWLVRAGAIRDLAAWAGPLLAAKHALSFLGTNRGGMFVAMAGTGTSGAPLRLNWSLAAGQGHGPYVPATASVILAGKLAGSEPVRAGAMPCFGLFTLSEFASSVADLDMTFSLERS